MDTSPANKGLTLLGVLVAALFLIVGVLAMGQLTVRSQQSASTSRDRFIAVGLAREGLELVRTLRDANFFSDADPWTGICLNDGTRRASIEALEDGTIKFGNTIQLNLKEDTPGYTHGVGDGEPGRYSREVVIDCADQSSSANQFIEVSSIVTWVDRAEDQSIELKTQLYDWH